MSKVKIPNTKHPFQVDNLRKYSKTVRIRLYAYDKCKKISARTGRPISEIVSMAIELIE